MSAGALSLSVDFSCVTVQIQPLDFQQWHKPSTGPPASSDSSYSKNPEEITSCAPELVLRGSGLFTSVNVHFINLH